MTIAEIENILLNISDKEENKANAEKSFNRIYREYGRYVGKVVGEALKSMKIYDKSFFGTIINNTFLVLYNKPFSFEFEKQATDDKSFKAWLAVVAKNELKSLLTDYFQKENTLTTDTVEPISKSLEVPEDLSESVNHKNLRKALDSLSERNKHILSMLYLYYEEGRDTPSNVLNQLCKQHQTTKSNIRQIKRRSEKKIIDYMVKNTNLKPIKNVK